MLLLHHTPVKLSISAKDSLMKFYVMQRLIDEILCDAKAHDET